MDSLVIVGVGLPLLLGLIALLVARWQRRAAATRAAGGRGLPGTNAAPARRVAGWPTCGAAGWWPHTYLAGGCVTLLVPYAGSPQVW